MNTSEHDAMQKLKESVWRLEAKTEVLEWLLGQLHAHEEIAPKLEAIYNHWLERAESEKSPMQPSRIRLMADAAKNLNGSLVISRHKLR